MSGSENNVSVRKPRRKLWWPGWILAGVIAGAALYRAEPALYLASTNILIIPQRVPEWMIKPTVTADLSYRLNIISQQILSRSRLERIIHDFDLYQAERRTTIMEDVVERMRRDIVLNIPSVPENAEPNNFSVSFQSTDPRIAMRVTDRLASLLVQENVEDRALFADQTDQFLRAQLEDLKRRIEESDLKLLDAKGIGSSRAWLAAEHDVLVARFKEIFALSEQSKAAVRLEQRQIGEQFKILDGARLPERPIAPTLFPFISLGALSGLGAGIVASFFRFVWRRGRPRPIAA